MNIKIRRERSRHILEWVRAHPLINVHLLCQMAGSPDSSSFSRAMAGKQRLVSQKYIDAIERLLEAYGYEPFKMPPSKE